MIWMSISFYLSYIQNAGYGSPPISRYRTRVTGLQKNRIPHAELKQPGIWLPSDTGSFNKATKLDRQS